MKNKRIIVIGAGAAGMMAAGQAASGGAEVLLLEKMSEPGKKLMISGKKRCNLTNSCSLEEFIKSYGRNGRFLYRAFSLFFREELLDLLRSYGVKTKTERGGRIFPVTDKAGDVVDAFRRFLNDKGVRLYTGGIVSGIEVRQGRAAAVHFNQKKMEADAVILAAGGASYPSTGSTGDGYKIAESLGHTIVKPRPALVPLMAEEVDLAKSMMGVSLKNVVLTAYRCRSGEIDQAGRKQVIESMMGEMMMTHFGIGGPITLQMSRRIVEELEKGPVSVEIDLKPALDMKQLQSRLQRDFDRYSKRSFQNILKELLPLKMIDPFVRLSGIDPEKPGCLINKDERDGLARLLKSLRFNIKKPLPLSTAMVTAGGVSLKEIDPHTMASKLVEGLYFCGEVMDIDADTGGYNLQAAFSTGYLAGRSAAAYVSGLTKG